MGKAFTAEGLMADSAWLRGLAFTLAGNAHDADDLVQESLIAAWHRKPDAERSLRPWLTKVIRDVAGMRRRSERRRERRERAALDDHERVQPDVMLDQLRLHKLLVDLLLELEEPFRSTIIARFVEGRTAAAIARAADVPESTVRGRLRIGLLRLRTQLDGKTGERKAWAPAVLALGKGAGLMAPPAKVTATVVAVLLLLLLIAGSGILVATRRHGSEPASESTRSGLVATRTERATRDAPDEDGAATQAEPWWAMDGIVRHRLAGRVVAADGSPISEALVQTYGWSAAITLEPESTTHTDADGRFRFLPPRDATIYRLVASAPHHAGRTVTADPRAPANEQDPENITIILDDCASSIEGTVSDNSSGPISGATILAGASGPFGATTMTDATGHYSMCLRREDDHLQVGADGYEHVTVPITGMGRQRVDIVLAPGGAVVGRIVDADTGAAVPNAQVFVAGAAASARYALTDVDGTFEIVDLAAGRLHLNVWSADHGFPSATDFEVESGKRTGPILIKLSAATTVSGRVLADGLPLPGASVRFDTMTAAGPVTTLRAVAGDDGRFVAVGVALMDGVRVRVDGALVDSPESIDTRRQASDLVINVRALAPIRGHVMRHGMPITDAVVHLTGVQPTTAVPSTNWATTDTSGHFAIPSPPPGHYELWAQSRTLGAFSSHGTAVVAPTTRDDDVLVELDGAASIAGVVVDESGAPLAGLSVRAVRTHGDDFGISTTAVDGTFTLDRIAGDGDYKLSVSAFAGAPQPLHWASTPPPSVHLSDGDARTSGVRLAVVMSSTTIRGVVIDDIGTPVPDALVRASPGESNITAGAMWPLARTDGDGQFEIQIVGDGPFRIEASLGGRPRARVDHVRRSATDVVLRLARTGRVVGTLVELAGASVTVEALATTTSAFAPTRYSARVDGDAFRLDDVTPGEYAVSAVSVAGRSAATVVTVHAGETTNLTLAATNVRRVHATVTVFDTGAPVAGARCVALAASGDVLPVRFGVPDAVQAVSDSNGELDFMSAPSGDAIVECDGTVTTSSGAARVVDPSTRVSVVGRALDERPGSVGLILDSTKLTPTIAYVMVDSAAAIAGLAPGDVVDAVDGKDASMLTADCVLTLIGSRLAGSTVEISVRRKGVRLDRTLVVAPPG